MAELHRTYDEKLQRVCIYTRNYGADLEKFLYLFDQLRKDFDGNLPIVWKPAGIFASSEARDKHPLALTMTPAKVEVVHYGPPRLERMWGLELVVGDPSKVPASYGRYSLEDTLTPRNLAYKRGALKKMITKDRRFAIIRTTEPGNTLQTFLDFHSVAQQDFALPNLENAEIKNYGGKDYRHMFGMEIELPKGTKIPRGYEVIEQLEYTL